MRFSSSSLLLALFSVALQSRSSVLAADSSKPADKSCTIHSSSGGSFFDLRPLQLKGSTDLFKTKSLTNESYHTRGYDYGANFTLNLCDAVVEPLEDVIGLPKHSWANVSAFYKDHRGDVFSLGQQNGMPILRGKKLLLNYTGGSPCPELDEDGLPIDSYTVTSLQERKVIGGHENTDDDDDDGSKISSNHPVDQPPKSSRGGNRRKSTLLSFICDTSPSLSSRPSIAFLSSPDHCTYVFEVRSRYACAGATPSNDKGTLGPGGVFGMIFAIGVLVYLIGGIVYQRSVMHQRGWRQLPNYSLWAGLCGFFSDMFIILFSSCSQSMPSMSRMFGGASSKRGGGYQRVGTEDRLNGQVGRGRTPDDENRLIDELNEEWED